MRDLIQLGHGILVEVGCRHEGRRIGLREATVDALETRSTVRHSERFWFSM